MLNRNKKSKTHKAAELIGGMVEQVAAPKKRKSHTKRNLLIGLGSAAAAVIAAGVSTKKDDAQ